MINFVCQDLRLLCLTYFRPVSSDIQFSTSDFFTIGGTYGESVVLPCGVGVKGLPVPVWKKTLMTPTTGNDWLTYFRVYSRRVERAHGT